MIAAALVSLIAGLALGLVIAWGAAPVEFKNADPADLKQSLKEDHLRMISAAYELDANLDLAKQRLAALELVDPALTFDTLITREKNSGNTANQDALIHLGNAVGLKLSHTTTRPPPGAPTPAVIYIVATPVPSILTFRLIEHTPLTCADEPETARLRITVRDSTGQGLPNIGIEIRNGDLNETIYTGLKPERGVGYADYEATPGMYAVRVLNAESETISDLRVGPAPADCRADRGATPRGWNLSFQQR